MFIYLLNTNSKPLIENVKIKIVKSYPMLEIRIGEWWSWCCV